jgi:(E)-4-hydroxy-3-methylbut-2-enyl-diphosphate synthase
MTKKIKIGDVFIGGGSKVAIQSMTTADTKDVDAVSEQILRLENAGCDIVRSSVYDMNAALAFKKIKEKIHIPLVADVHFDHRLAIAAVENGADKLRINPGNITEKKYIKILSDCAKAHKVPIRIGVNGGSLSQAVREKFGENSPEALVESAMENVRLLEDTGYYDICISVKSSNVRKMIKAYELLSKKCDYPLHLGVTEAGTADIGAIKNAIGIGALLLEGIGDTIRVSLTGDPVEEVYAAQNILRSIGMYNSGVEIISCPMCARTRIPLESIVGEVKNATRDIKKSIKVAVMGCVVNGPGEAKDADIGLAGGGGNGEKAVVFKTGQMLASGNIDEMKQILISEIHKMNN